MKPLKILPNTLGPIENMLFIWLWKHTKKGVKIRLKN